MDVPLEYMLQNTDGVHACDRGVEALWLCQRNLVIQFEVACSFLECIIN